MKEAICLGSAITCTLENGIEKTLAIYPELTRARVVLEEIVEVANESDRYTRFARDFDRRLDELGGELVSLVEQSQGSQAQEAAA
jgi:hypothetical protein